MSKKKIFGIIIICILVVFGIALLVLALLSNSRYKQAKEILAELKAKGIATKMEDLAPPDIPDSKNAAILLAEAFQ